MIPDKITSIINSCNTHAQLETCEQWVEYIYTHIEDLRLEAMTKIKQRKIQVEMIQIKPLIASICQE